MKRQTFQANWIAYVGIGMLVVGSFPFMDTEFENSRMFEAGWHLWLFLGAAMVTYGLETLRRTATRARRQTQ